MRQASTFTPLEDANASQATGWGRSFLGALDASAFTIPLSLGAVVVIYGRHAPDMLSSALAATLIGLALLQLAATRSQRPVVYSARFLEATTLAALVGHMAVQLPSWGLPDTPETRAAALKVTTAGAAVVMALLYLVRADRFSRYIPTPVFAGFRNSIAVSLFISETVALHKLVDSPGTTLWGVVVIAGSVFAVGVAVRHWLPRWPATATGLALGLGVGELLSRAGEHVTMVGSSDLTVRTPGFTDFLVFAAPGIEWLSLSGALVGQAAILGIIMFLNSAMTAQMLSQQDDRPAGQRGLQVAPAAAGVLAALLGAAPLSGSAQSSMVATRHARLATPLMLCMSAIAILVAFSGGLSHVPIAAIAGALLCEAWFMVDRESIELLRRWLRRDKLRALERENLALVAAVTATAVVLNIVAAVVVGFLLGLLLFAARNAARPARAVLTGSQVSSNCARPRADIQQLSRHGHELRVVELTGDLFFVAVTSLESQFRTVLGEARCVVVDWTGVRHVDASVVATIDKIERLAELSMVPLFHVDPARSAPEVGAALQLQARGARVAEDLDHALEQAENHLLRLYGPDEEIPSTTLLDAVSIFRDLDDRERLVLDAAMEQRLFRAGDIVIEAGSAGNELMVVLQGSASVIVPGPHQRGVRLAGVRRGAVIGELAFLDRATRSATVLAEEDLAVTVLTRERFEQLSHSAPQLVHKLLANLAIDLAARLRHTNRLATERQAGR